VSGKYSGGLTALLNRERERKDEERSETVPQSGIPQSSSAQSELPQSGIPQKSTVLLETPKPVHSGTVPLSALPQSGIPQSGTIETAPLPEAPRDAIRENFTKIPNVVYDHPVLTTLNPATVVVYHHLLRLTIGFNRDRCTIGLHGLARRTGLSKNGVIKALRQLEAFRLAESAGIETKSSSREERGTVYIVRLPGEALPQSGIPQSGSARSGSPQSAHMKEEEKEIHERASVYDVRKIAARFVERRDPGYSLGQLHEDVRTVLRGEGREVDESVLADATRGMLPS
jgi:hypothetical protein